MSGFAVSAVVTKTRVVLALFATVAALAASAAGLALYVSIAQTTWSLPSATTLLEACARVVPTADVGSFAVLGLATLGSIVLVLTARSAFRGVRAARRVVARLRVVERRRFDGVEVEVFDHRGPLAFCAGLLRPRIYVSTGTIGLLTPEQLGAVLAHEAHHAGQRDPLRMLVSGVLADGLFFAPALRRLAQRYAALAELAADRAAAASQRGDAGALAGALLAFERADPAVVGIEPERADHLLGEPPRWGLPVALVAWAVAASAGVGALTTRLVAARQDAVSLPVVVAELCMALMAIGPVVLVATAMLGSRRALRGRR